MQIMENHGCLTSTSLTLFTTKKDHQKTFRPHNATLFNIRENEYIYNAGSKGW